MPKTGMSKNLADFYFSPIRFFYKVPQQNGINLRFDKHIIDIENRFMIYCFHFKFSQVF